LFKLRFNPANYTIHIQTHTRCKYILLFNLKDHNSQYTVHVSYLELYNEVGYDLLDITRDAKKLEDLPRVLIMEDDNERIHLKNLSVIQSMNEEEALNHLFVGVIWKLNK
jgi:hypothetical protein